jgi:aryl-alcohol dehydrogenase-like predicted oxidoreductase
MKLVDQARTLAEDLGCTLPQLAIAWVLAKSSDIVTIPGTKSLDHLKENIGANEVALSPEIVARLDEIFHPEVISGARYNADGQASVTTECFPFETLA